MMSQGGIGLGDDAEGSRGDVPVVSQGCPLLLPFPMSLCRDHQTLLEFSSGCFVALPWSMGDYWKKDADSI